MTISYGVTGLAELSVELAKAPVRVIPAVMRAVSDTGDDLRDAWKANARVTAGKHGRLYPDTITSTPRLSAGLLGSIVVDVGPDSDKPQGGMGMGFEFGSVNQPPHLDGTRATDMITPLLYKRLSDALVVFG